MAAGHRPCGYCRRAAYRAFCDGWQAATGARLKARQMDSVLHAERVRGMQRARDRMAMTSLPDHSFCLWRGQPHLVRGPRLIPYAPGGYGPPVPRPVHGRVAALTPAAMRAVLAAGYAPILHGSAGD